MNIKTSINGFAIELQVPEIVEQDGKWWEPTEYREAVYDEKYFYAGNIHKCITSKTESWNCFWIASVIPKPTPDQLRAIGMRLNGGRPMEAKDGDKIWWNECNWPVIFESEHIGKYRWILEDVPVEKPDVHTSCEGCEDRKSIYTVRCKSCCERPKLIGEIRMNWTPAPAPVAKCIRCRRGLTDSPSESGWMEIEYELKTGICFKCIKRLFEHMNMVEEASTPAPKDTEKRYTIKEFQKWIINYANAMSFGDSERYVLKYASIKISDSQDGIEAVTAREV